MYIIGRFLAGFTIDDLLVGIVMIEWFGFNIPRGRDGASLRFTICDGAQPGVAAPVNYIYTSLLDCGLLLFLLLQQQVNGLGEQEGELVKEDKVMPADGFFKHGHLLTGERPG